MPSEYVCFLCEQPVGYWYYGWKHQTGGGSAPTCNRTPVPIKRGTIGMEVAKFKTLVERTRHLVLADGKTRYVNWTSLGWRIEWDPLPNSQLSIKIEPDNQEQPT